MGGEIFQYPAATRKRGHKAAVAFGGPESSEDDQDEADRDNQDDGVDACTFRCGRGRCGGFFDDNVSRSEDKNLRYKNIF